MGVSLERTKESTENDFRRVVDEVSCELRPLTTESLLALGECCCASASSSRSCAVRSASGVFIRRGSVGMMYACLFR